MSTTHATVTVADSESSRVFRDVTYTRTADGVIVLTTGDGYVVATYPRHGIGKWLSVGVDYSPEPEPALARCEP